MPNSSDTINAIRVKYKRIERDFLSPISEDLRSAPSKRQKFDKDAALLFGDTDDLDLDDDLLDIDLGRGPVLSTRRPVPTPTVAAAVPPVSLPPPPVVRYRKVLKHLPTVPYVPLTVSNGDRLYLRLFPNQSEVTLEVKEVDPRTVTIETRAYKSILGLNFHALRREAELLKQGFKQVVDKLNIENQEGSQGQRPRTENGMLDIDMELELAELDAELWGMEAPVTEKVKVTGSDIKVNKKPSSKVDGTLLVEKYKPKGYMDLLSEESVNHDLLHWLKLWDNCVFGRDYLAKHKATQEKFAALDAKEKENSWKKVGVQDEAYDEIGRPLQKIVLLHGPAGLGKTTAAHVIAKHAGYNVVEMNASDDRSVDVFRKILDSTTESKSEMFQDGRPNCLVVDEIDGSPTATVDVLVNLVNGKSKGKKKKVLRRPIICICNELFIPALKNLRQVALVLQFQAIPVSSLVERIEEISLKEDLNLDNGLLHSIAEKSECDIRSCLSTMQFIKQRNGKVCQSVLNQLGTKDKSKGVFSVWEDVFFLPDGKKYYDSKDPTKAESRFSNVLSSVQNFGDYEKLLGGVFENYLKAKYRDSFFETILKTLRWSTWFHEINGKINLLQNYSLFGYLPLYFVATHFLCAGRTRFSLQFPTNTAQSQSTRFSTNFKTQLADIPASIGRFLSLNDAILDLYPSMLSIIQPSTIRPIPSQLWSQSEKSCLQNIVNIMLGYHLSYTQQRSLEGKYFYQIDPDIEELVRFPSEDVSTQQQFPYTLKQIISREIEIEKMRQEEPKAQLQDPEACAAVPEVEKSGPNIPAPAPTAHSSQWKPPPAKVQEIIKPIAAKDFFGRPIVPKPVTVEQAKIIAKKANASGIWYQYKEGFSNSVRKKLKVKDFM